MRRSIFGTDGVRGVANQPPMTVETGVALGRAIAHLFARGEARPRILIGKDTRLSGYLFENAIAAGVCAAGAHAYLMGPVPTPGVAFLTVDMRAAAGIVISASHNPFSDNGIKIFGNDGYKLSDDLEVRIDSWVARGETPQFDVTGTKIGKAHRIRDVLGRYIVYLKSTFPRELSLEGLRICVDCANGAAYKAAPLVFEELGARVTPLGVEPDGTNINSGCGALHPERLQAEVLRTGANIGVALDGDADRCILVDERGNVVDGDAIIGLSALWLKSRSALPGSAVVATIMSNLGLERALEGHGIRTVRCPVGDRHVVQRMRQEGIALGGEQSGHVIFAQHSTTGDGVLTALTVLAQMVASGRPLSELVTFYEPMPQVLESVKVREKVPLKDLPTVLAAIEAAEARLRTEGRINVRYSGTERKCRVMAEGSDAELVAALVRDVCVALEGAVGER